MSERVHERSIYVRTANGWFYREALPGDDLQSEHMITREKKNGARVDEMRFNILGGYIQDLFVTDMEYQGRTLYFINVKILSDTDGKMRHLKIEMFNSVALGILDRIENVIIEEPVEIRTGFKDDRSFSWIVQNGENVKKKYTKENPGDKPDWKPFEINGKTEWDKTEQRNWWISKVRTLRRGINLRAVSV
jgi:hypothetical protein